MFEKGSILPAKYAGRIEPKIEIPIEIKTAHKIKIGIGETSI
jgi:hypothetical protein